MPGCERTRGASSVSRQANQSTPPRTFPTNEERLVYGGNEVGRPGRQQVARIQAGQSRPPPHTHLTDQRGAAGDDHQARVALRVEKVKLRGVWGRERGAGWVWVRERGAGGAWVQKRDGRLVRLDVGLTIHPGGPTVTCGSSHMVLVSLDRQIRGFPGGPMVTCGSSHMVLVSLDRQIRGFPGGPMVTCGSSHMGLVSLDRQIRGFPGGPMITCGSSHMVLVSLDRQKRGFPGGPTVTSPEGPATWCW